MTIPLHALTPDAIEDIKLAEEDVPLIEGDRLTAAGLLYLVDSTRGDEPRERYRAVYVPQIPMHALTVEVESLEQAVIALESITALSIFEFENRIKPDYSDFGTIERWTDDDWEDVDEEEYAHLIDAPIIKVGDTKDEQ